VRPGNLHVQVSRDKDARARVRDLRGNLLATLEKTGSGEFRSPPRALPPGLAILEVTGPGLRVRRLIELR